MIFPIGTLVNVAAVLVGGGIGMTAGARLPQRVRDVVFQGLGLATLVLGMSMAIKTANPLVLIFSLVLGGILGAWVRLEEGLAGLGDRLKRATGMRGDRFTEGLLTAFLLFCVGAMTILGSVDEGLRGDPTLLYTKSMLDGFAAIALAATYGPGVLFSVVPLFLFQYGITLSATAVSGYISQDIISELAAVGGALILGIGCNLLQIARIRLGDLLPSLVVVVVLSLLVD